MPLVVHKYGGTSVASPDHIKRVAARIARTRAQGNDVVVVASAMGKMTDELVDLAHEITSEPDAREFDMLLATGEQISVALLAMALHELGVQARSFTGPQAGFRTDAWHTKARIASIDAERLRRHLAEGETPLVCGFQGLNAHGDIATLGRGGSDTSAVALAAVLKADICEICTDVKGVYTADPRLVPDARKLDKISYDEMLELASLGAGVMQTRSVEFAKKYEVPLYICSTHDPEPGTMVIHEEPSMEQVMISGLGLDVKEAKLTIHRVPDRPGVAAGIFQRIAEQNIVVDMIIQNVSEAGYSDISFTIPEEDLPKVRPVVDALVQEWGAREVTADPNIAKVSAVGVGMRSHSGAAAAMFRALADANINIDMISTSEIKISCVVAAENAERALQALHKAFELDLPPHERSHR